LHPKIELERPVFRTFTIAAAVAMLGAVAAVPASAKGGSAHGAQTGAPVVNLAMLEGRSSQARPRRKGKTVLRCAIFGRYIKECRVS
jgi:hypothetical protein